MAEKNPHLILRLLSAFLLGSVVLLPHFLGLLGSLRVNAIAIGLLALAVELYLSPLSRRKSALWVTAAGAYVAVTLVLIELLAMRLDNRLFAVNSEHLLIVLPLFSVVGILIYKSPGARAYLLMFLGLASAVAILAISEALLDRSLLGRDLAFLTSQREGLNRALVGSEHVLVLGATMAAAVPLTLKLRSSGFQLAVSALLVAGCWASGSRAPALLCTAVAIVQCIPPVRGFFQRHTWILVSGALVVLVAVGYMSLFVWTPYIAGSTGLEYSANYRGASYAILPEILGSHPFGYLLSGPPAGLWTVGSELRGPVDIGVSADSELIFSAFGLGWIGLAMYVTAFFTSIAAIKHDVSIGLAAVLLTALGLVLALHSWDGMSPLWYSLLGISAYLVFTRAKRPLSFPRRIPGTVSIEKERVQSLDNIKSADG